MQLLHATLTASMAFVAGISALSIPTHVFMEAHEGLSKKDNATTPQLYKDQSSLLGWQLAGVALSNDDIDYICDGINHKSMGSIGGDYDIWQEEGLIITSINDTVCAGQVGPGIALPRIRTINTGLFLNLIEGSFDTSDSKTAISLCNYLNHSMVDSFNIDSNLIIDSICDMAQTSPLPASFGYTPAPKDALDAFVTAASTLYATLYASAAESDSALNQWCAHFPNYISNVNNLDLNGQVVQSTLCEFAQRRKPPCDVEGRDAIRQSYSTMFSILTANASVDPDYPGWVCQNLGSKADSMEDLGLDSDLILQSLKCSDD